MSTILDALRRAEEAGAPPGARDSQTPPPPDDEGPGGAGDGGPPPKKKNPSLVAVAAVAALGLGIGGLAARYLVPGSEEAVVAESEEAVAPPADAPGDHSSAARELVPERLRERRAPQQDKPSRLARTADPFTPPAAIDPAKEDGVAAAVPREDRPGDAAEAVASADAGPDPEPGAAASEEEAADAEASAGEPSAPQLANAEPVTAEPIESTGSAAPSTAPGQRAKRTGGRKADKPGAADVARDRGDAQLAKASRAGAKPFSPRPPSAGAAGAPVPGAVGMEAEPFAESMEDDAEAAVDTEMEGDVTKLEVLGTPPSGAPEVSLLFIQWSRVPEKRVASLRSAGGRLVVVHEGDLVEGMRVATIHPDAIEFVWRGSQFQVIAARY